MLRFCEACNRCSFDCLASLIENVIAEAVFASYNVKLSLPISLMFLSF